MLRNVIKCQRFALAIHIPAEEYYAISNLWQFFKWEIDIVGPLPISVGWRKFLLVGIDYFSKWIKAKPFAHIRVLEVESFLWENIICRYGILTKLHSNNETQFGSKEILNLCEELGIKNNFSTVDNPQSNSQAEKTNKTILKNLKKRLERAKGRWAKELPGVLWAYRITKRESRSETSFSLVYGIEAIIPMEVQHPTLRINR